MLDQTWRRLEPSGAAKRASASHGLAKGLRVRAGSSFQWAAFFSQCDATRGS